MVGLLGPNGGAKTSTIRLLITVLAPTRGQFSVVGHPATTTIAIRRCVRVLSESSGYPGSRARGRRSTAATLTAVVIAAWGPCSCSGFWSVC